MSSAENWTLENMTSLSDTNDNYVTISELQQSGYLEAKNVINPITDEEMNGCIIIKYDDSYKQYTYRYEDESCSDVQSVPIITLNGDTTITIGIGETYAELSATALYKEEDITSSIVIINNIDNTKVGTYTVRYNVTYNGKSAKEVTRTVKVVDKSPIIVLSAYETSTYQKSVTIDVTVTPYTGNTISTLVYKLNGGTEQTVNNNQIVIDTEGDNTIEVIATDNEGNNGTITSGTYKIDTTSPTITFAEGDSAGITLKVSEVASYNLKTGVSVTDNTTITLDNVTVSGDLSAIIGDYTITYTATDEAGNSTSKTRNIVVEADCETTITLMEKSIVSCDTASIDPDSNLRFVGSNPSNYVKFNNELWRIIGVFDGQTKIIRNEYYSTSIAWDASYNNWAEADLQATLNGTYLTSIQTNEPTSYSYIDLTHSWNIGGTANYDTATRIDFYNAERSETTAGAEGSEATWTGAIGLMYPSDYGYTSSGATETCDSTVMYNWKNHSDCYSNSWLYDISNNQWTLTPRSDYSNRVFFVQYIGYIRSHLGVNSTGGARPALFLKSNVKIVDGLGTDQEPFILGT